MTEQEETHTMQLAAISTASMQNTESTVKDRIGNDNPYWSVAYEDTCKAVDREMRHRDKAKELRYALRELLGLCEDQISGERKRLEALPIPEVGLKRLYALQLLEETA